MLNIGILFNIGLLDNPNFGTNSIFNGNDNESDKILEEIGNESLLEEEFEIDLLKSAQFKQVTGDNISQFEVLEKSQGTKTIYEQYVGNAMNGYELGVPEYWNATDFSINATTYEKKQLVQDNAFQPDDAWNYDRSNPIEGDIEVQNEDDAGRVRFRDNRVYSKKFYQGEWGNISQTVSSAATGAKVHKGEVLQTGGESTPIDDDFPTDPGYTPDESCPYGGEMGSGDIVDLYHQTDYLVCYIDPADLSLQRKNPSIAWTTSINIPFKVEYAELEISWRMNNYGFEYNDLYQVVARVNDKKIDGRYAKEGDWLLNATSETIAYYVIDVSTHAEVTRTFDITNLIEGESDSISVDFGIWSTAPTAGDDVWEVKFDSLRIYANASTRHKIGELKFDFKYEEGGDKISDYGPFTEDYFNLYLSFNDGSKKMPLLTFREIMLLTDSSIYHYVLNISDLYLEEVERETFDFELLYICDVNTLTNWEFDLKYFVDNVFINLTYDHPDPAYSKLQLSVNGSAPDPITSQPQTIVTSGWEGGKMYNLSFSTTNDTFRNSLYVDYDINISYIVNRTSEDMAIATYEVNPSQNLMLWNVTYNNTDTHNSLVALNQSYSVIISNYTIRLFDLPAFDGEGANSIDWNITNLIKPNGEDYNPSLLKYNRTANKYLQRVLINNPYSPGIWGVQAKQPNYLDELDINATLYYSGEVLQFNASTYNETIFGNYTVNIYNSSNDLVEGSRFNPNVLGNLTDLWTVVDNGVGVYTIEVFWNDTSFVEQTTRIGFWNITFEFWRKTQAALLLEPPSLPAGSIASFRVSYNSTEPSQFGLTGANVECWENNSGNPGLWEKWGIQWVSVYLLESFIDDSGGNYSLKLKTSGIPQGDYYVRTVITKDFYQPQNLSSWINITGQQISISVTWGASWNDSLPINTYVIWTNNTPYVNDTINSVIQVKLVNKTQPTQVLEDGTIIAQLGSNVFYGIEVYAISHNEEDKGLYNITLDTTDFHISQGNDNKTLFITCSAPSFSSGKINVSTFIDPIPTMVTTQEVQSIYEDGQIEVQGIFYSLIDPSDPEIIHGGLFWTIGNESNDRILSGEMELYGAGLYVQTISLTGASYLFPGDYYVNVNGSLIDCLNSTSVNKSFTINAKKVTNLSITLPGTIRIKQSFQIRCRLVFENGTALANRQLYLNISLETKLGDTYSFLVLLITGGDGRVTYEHIIAAKYELGEIRINGSYMGEYWINPAYNNSKQDIFGKITSSLTHINLPSTVQVGYNATYTIRLNITGYSVLSNYLILFSAYYDSSTEAFMLKDLYTDINGLASYTIVGIFDYKYKLKVLFEFLGTELIAFSTNESEIDIIQKWNTTITFPDLGYTPRFGQIIPIYMNFSCVEDPSLSYEGLGVTITIIFGTNTNPYRKYIERMNESGKIYYRILFDYTIADLFAGTLNITVSFDGTTQIASESTVKSLLITNKLITTLKIITLLPSQLFTGEYFLSINLTDSSGAPLIGYKVLFEVLDSNGNVIFNTTSITNAEGIASASLVFSSTGYMFSIRVSFAEEGIYTASEVISEDLRVVDTFIVFLDYLPYILLIVGILIAALFAYQRAYLIPKRRRYRESLKLMYETMSDVENIQYFLVLTKEGGVPVFSTAMSEIPIEEALVSGFLSAISTFGSEIGSKMKSGDELKGGLEELAYQQFKIVLNEGKFVRVAVLLLKKPSSGLKIKLAEFNKKFEEKYRPELERFSGMMFEEIQVLSIIESVFSVDLLYPYHLITHRATEYQKNLKKTDIKAMMLNYIIKEKAGGSFYVQDIISSLKTLGMDEIQSFDALQTLKRENICFAINPRTSFLIDKFEPLIRKLDSDDTQVLFAVFEGNQIQTEINKYMLKHKIKMKKMVADSLVILYELRLVTELNTITSSGEVVVTLLKLLPDLTA